MIYPASHPTTPAYFSELETGLGLPGGIIDTKWLFESARGHPKWMLNPETGAAGHFGIMPANYERDKIDPHDLRESAEWSAQRAARAKEMFPRLDPVSAIMAYHYGGPNTAMWGPKTTDYVNRARERYGMPPITNASLVAGAGGNPAGRAGPIEEVSVPQIPSIAPMAMPAPMSMPSRRPLNTRDLVRDPRFWFDMAASMNPQQAPMAALVTGLSNAYTRADERRLAFEDKLSSREERAQRMNLARMQNQLAMQQLTTKMPLERQRVLNEIARINLARQGLEKEPVAPSAVRSFNYFKKIFGEEKAARMVSPGGVLPEEAAALTEAKKWAEMAPVFIKEKSDELGVLTTQLEQTQKLLSDFESGLFKGKTGPLRGLITPYFDPDAAVIQAQNISFALQQMSNVNLAPISNYETGLLRALYASETKNEAQNIAILKEVRRVQSKKIAGLREIIRRLNEGESQREIYLNPPSLDIDMNYEITPTGIRRIAKPDEGPRTERRGWGDLLEEF